MMKTGRFAVPALLIMRAFLLSTFALQCQDFPIQQVASSVISFALEHVSVQAAGYLPSAEDINYQMIRSVASTLTHITVDSSKRGRITVFTVSRVILPVTELSKLAFAKALRKVHKAIVDKRTFERLRELASPPPNQIARSSTLLESLSTARLRPELSTDLLQSYPM